MKRLLLVVLMLLLPLQAGWAAASAARGAAACACAGVGSAAAMGGAGSPTTTATPCHEEQAQPAAPAGHTTAGAAVDAQADGEGSACGDCGHCPACHAAAAPAHLGAATAPLLQGSHEAARSLPPHPTERLPGRLLRPPCRHG